MRKIVFVIVGCLVFAACGNKYKGFKKTGNGLYYRFFTENTTRYVPENDDIVYLEMSLRLEDNTVIDAKQMRVAMKPWFSGNFYEALSLMHEGDSAEFIINAKKYFEVSNYGQIPDFVKDDKTMLWLTIRIDSIQTLKQWETAKAEAKLVAERKVLEDYLAENHLTAAPQTSGLYYIETKEGKGNKPAIGQTVFVHYTGKLLDGTVFDSSIERGAPTPFKIGIGQVIKGWDEGIPMMKKGGKAILLIPSYLAYGEGSVGIIPPSSP
jgi:FKBP-type peptidyl-prolyl cis-trans isomerase 2